MNTRACRTFQGKIASRATRATPHIDWGVAIQAGDRTRIACILLKTADSITARTALLLQQCGVDR